MSESNNGVSHNQEQPKLYKYIDIADRICNVYRLPPKHLLIIQQVCKDIAGKDHLTREEGHLLLCVSIFTSPIFLLPVFQTEEKIKKLASYLYSRLPSALKESTLPPQRDEEGKDIYQTHAVVVYGFRAFRCSNSPDAFDVYEEKIVENLNFPFFEVQTILLRPLADMLLDDILEGRRPVTAPTSNVVNNLRNVMPNANFTPAAEKSQTFVR